MMHWLNHPTNGSLVEYSRCFFHIFFRVVWGGCCFEWSEDGMDDGCAFDCSKWFIIMAYHGCNPVVYGIHLVNGSCMTTWDAFRGMPG